MTATTPTEGAGALPEGLVAARAALARHAWQEAFDGFTAADREQPLAGSDLEALAEAAFFTADIDTRERALERAFKSHLDAGDPIRAASVALGMAIDLSHQGRSSISSAWTRRAARLLDDSTDTYAHGYLALARSGAAWAEGASTKRSRRPRRRSASHHGRPIPTCRPSRCCRSAA